MEHYSHYKITNYNGRVGFLYTSCVNHINVKDINDSTGKFGY